MRVRLLCACALTVIATPTFARGGGGHSGGSRSSGGVHYTAPHVTKSGTFVQGHMSTNPNSTRNDNFSTKGNVNPYTGVTGTKPRDGEPR